MTDGKDDTGEDYVIPGPPLPDGGRLAIRHRGDHVLQVGEMHNLENGEPLDDSVSILEPKEGTPFYKVGPTIGELRKGPSKVNSKAYKDGYDRIFGSKPDRTAN